MPLPLVVRITNTAGVTNKSVHADIVSSRTLEPRVPVRLPQHTRSAARTRGAPRLSTPSQTHSGFMTAVRLGAGISRYLFDFFSRCGRKSHGQLGPAWFQRTLTTSIRTGGSIDKHTSIHVPYAMHLLVPSAVFTIDQRHVAALVRAASRSRYAAHVLARRSSVPHGVDPAENGWDAAADRCSMALGGHLVARTVPRSIVHCIADDANGSSRESNRALHRWAGKYLGLPLRCVYISSESAFAGTAHAHLFGRRVGRLGRYVVETAHGFGVGGDIDMQSTYIIDSDTDVSPYRIVLHIATPLACAHNAAAQLELGPAHLQLQMNIRNRVSGSSHRKSSSPPTLFVLVCATRAVVPTRPQRGYVDTQTIDLALASLGTSLFR
ncbi:hypothetical protein B0H13DRAFT_2374966 [Mycena leptocephala]|nr:hypothetical protein B0H13DRAFT_2374966 [Mycena leptocephala]